MTLILCDLSTTCVEVIFGMHVRSVIPFVFIAQCSVYSWLIVRVGVVLRMTIVGCDPVESMLGWLIVRVGVVLRRTIDIVSVSPFESDPC